MIGQALELLKMMLDPETRRTVSVIYSYLLKSDGDWEKNIKTLSARFGANEEYKVRGFGKFLLAELETIGLPKEAIEDCRVVLDELVANAFCHGCEPSSRGWVKVKVTYSPWFARIVVKDSGQGFNLKEILAKLEETGEQHGLQIVDKLCYQLETNKRGNAVTGFVAADASLKLSAESERWLGKDIAVIKIENLEQSAYLEKTWEMLRHALRNTKHDLVLVDYRYVYWSTRKIRRAKEVMAGLRKDGRRYALMVNRDTARIFDLTVMRESNIEIFVCKDDTEVDRVKDWLVGALSGESAHRELAPEATLGQEIFSVPVSLRSGDLDSQTVLAKLTYTDLKGLHTYLMTKDEIVIGREDPSVWADICLLASTDVSREHVRIQRTFEGDFKLKDLSSLGTTVSGVSIPQSLQSGDGGVRDLDIWVNLPDKAKIGLAGVIYIDFESLRS